MENLLLRKQISKIFKLNGLTVRSDGVKYLCNLLEPVAPDERELWVERIIETIQKLPLTTSIINEEDIKKAALGVNSAESDDIEDLLQIVDILKVPKLIYNIERKKFIIRNGSEIALHGEAIDKTNLFRNRYTIVHQRTVNHEIFRPCDTIVGNDSSKQFKLIKIDYLLGLSSKKTSVIVLGLLTQLTEGQFYLEDDTGVVKVDLKDAKFHNGLFAPNCFLLVEGTFDDAMLRATAIGMPPAESSETSRALLGNINYFGGQGSTCSKFSKQMIAAEQDQRDAMLVFISDLWLDKLQVLKKLRILFQGFSSFPPVAFVFCGNFLSESYGSKWSVELKAGFTALCDIVLSFPDICAKSRFIFVPGPSDPGPGNIYPRPSIPKFLVEDFIKKVPGSIFTSNPCRLLYCTQEIVIFREDIFSKVCRNSVYFPEDSQSIYSHFARTIVSQAHLSPVPLHSIPIYWSYDHCMHLHPTPDLIVIADKGDPFTERYNSTVVVNPGSFMKTDYSFKVYMLATKEIEDSEIKET